MTSEDSKKILSTPTEEQVLIYLEQHPHFLHEHPEMLLTLLPPEKKHDGNVEDFQHFMLQRLQGDVSHLKDHLRGLIHNSRENMSLQSQVQFAVLEIIRAGDLQALLQLLTQDLQQRFDVDLVRLMLEFEPILSPGADMPAEPPGSGLRAMLPGTAEALMGADSHIHLIPDIHAPEAAGIAELLEDCSGMVASCALVRLDLPRLQQQAMVVFAVRRQGHFYPEMGREMLHFLGQVIAWKLEQCLLQEGIDGQ
jgi:hypothetical protein